MEEKTYRCSQCKRKLPIDCFYSNRLRAGGIQAYCRDCNKKRCKDWRKRNPNHFKTPEFRDYQYQYKYGITLAEFQQKFDKQNGRCAICNQTQEKLLVVDHNHNTGQVRDLLCNNCNTVLGYVKEDPAILIAALAYLQKHNS